MKRYKGTNWVAIRTRLCVIRYAYARISDYEVAKIIAELQYLGEEGLKNSENFDKLIGVTMED